MARPGEVLCAELCKDGQPCKNPPKKGSTICATHSRARRSALFKTVEKVADRTKTVAKVVSAAGGLYGAASAIAENWPQIQRVISHFIGLCFSEDLELSERLGLPRSERREIKELAKFEKTVRAFEDAQTPEKRRAAAFSIAAYLNEHLLAAHAVQSPRGLSISVTNDWRSEGSLGSEKLQEPSFHGYYRHLLTAQEIFEREMENAYPELHTELADFFPYYARPAPT